jgi:hypothetical protein
VIAKGRRSCVPVAPVDTESREQVARCLWLRAARRSWGASRVMDAASG